MKSRQRIQKSKLKQVQRHESKLLIENTELSSRIKRETVQDMKGTKILNRDSGEKKEVFVGQKRMSQREDKLSELEDKVTELII